MIKGIREYWAWNTGIPNRARPGNLPLSMPIRKKTVLCRQLGRDVASPNA